MKYKGEPNMKEITVKDVGMENKRRVLEFMIRQKSASRSELAEACNISVMTVKKVVESLMEKGLLEVTKIDTGVGRKPGILSLKSTLGDFVCIDLTSSLQAEVVVYSLAGEAATEFSYSFHKEKSYKDNLYTMVAEIQKKVVCCAGVGISAAGTYNGVTDSVPHDLIQEYEGFLFKDFFTKAFGVENVVIGHDVHFAAMAEAVQSGVKNLYYLYIGHGVGSSILVDGAPLLGYSFSAGEVGGCKTASGKNMHSSCSMKKLIKSSGVNSFDEFWEEAKKSGTLSEKLLQESIEACKTFLYNIVCLLNPEKIVIDSPHEGYANEILKEAKAYCQEEFGKLLFSYEFAMDGSSVKGNSALLGLYDLLLQKYLSGLIE